MIPPFKRNGAFLPCTESRADPEMTFPTTVDGLTGLELPSRPLHLAIGMFDGVHLGHQAVIEAAIHGARRSGGISGVLTFDPHPSRLFRPHNHTRLLMPRVIKEAMLADMGVDLTIVQPFDHDFAAIPAEAFLERLKTSLESLASVYVGENFRFGQGRSGDVGVMIQTAQKLGLSVYSAERIRENGEPISSTRIRAELEAGNIERANTLLGHSYRSLGQIISGRQLGRTIGFPTINLPWAPELAPRYGVYAVRARKRGGAPNWLSGVANYGMRPTVEDSAAEPLLEVHCLEMIDWQVGDIIEVLWESFIRPEQKFGGIEALKAQIAQDRDAARKFFSL